MCVEGKRKSKDSLEAGQGDVGVVEELELVCPRASSNRSLCHRRVSNRITINCY